MDKSQLYEAECKGCGKCLKAPSLEHRINIIADCLEMGQTQETLEMPIEINYNSGDPAHTSLLIQPITNSNCQKVPTKIISIAPNSDNDENIQNLVFHSNWDGINKNILIAEATRLSQFYQKYDTEDKKHNEEVMQLTLLLDSLLKEHLKKTDISNIKYSVKDFIKLKQEYEIINKENPHYSTQLACAGLLHDIGKIFIPSEILKAPRGLTPKEMEIIRHHPIHGYHILNKLEGFEIAANTALYHHEQYSKGNGYYKSKGQKIPFYANLVAMADVIHVMVNKRAYKKESSLEMTIDMILGKHDGDGKGNFQGFFHPTLVQVLVDNADKFQSFLDNFK